jgi:hypothetical protein
MSFQLVLAISIHVVVVLIAAWDIYVMATGRPHDTVSLIMREWSAGHPIFPLLMGIVLGHIFWSNCPEHDVKNKTGDDDLVIKCQIK